MGFLGLKWGNPLEQETKETMKTIMCSQMEHDWDTPDHDINRLLTGGEVRTRIYEPDVYDSLLYA